MSICIVEDQTDDLEQQHRAADNAQTVEDEDGFDVIMSLKTFLTMKKRGTDTTRKMQRSCLKKATKRNIGEFTPCSNWMNRLLKRV